MQTTPSSITGSWSPASRTSKSLSLQRHSGEGCGRYWIHCRRHRGGVARILVMDDDGTLRGAIRVALEAAGYEVLEAADGHAGLRLQREQGADLVLVDIFMPERDGLEVIRALRDRKSTRLNSSHGYISYAVFCLKKKKTKQCDDNDDGDGGVRVSDVAS